MYLQLYNNFQNKYQVKYQNAHNNVLSDNFTILSENALAKLTYDSKNRVRFYFSLAKMKSCDRHIVS